MRLFAAVHQPALADQLRVGLEAFGDIEVDVGSGVLALEKIRCANLDGLLVALDPAVPEHDTLLEQVRREMPQLDVIAIGHEAQLERLRADKVRGRLFALLIQPLEPLEFFRAIRRLRERHASPARAR